MSYKKKKTKNLKGIRRTINGENYLFLEPGYSAKDSFYNRSEFELEKTIIEEDYKLKQKHKWKTEDQAILHG